MSGAAIPAPPPDASASVRGLVNTTSQSFSGVKNFLTGLQVNGVDVATGSGGVSSMGAFGSSPNANGASIAGSVITLQPADGTHPGGVSTAAQAFGGVKTFNNKVVIGDQGGYTNALEFANDDYIHWANNGAQLGAFGTMIYSPSNGFRCQAYGYWIGGVYISFDMGGMTASANAALADVTQTDTAYEVAIRAYKGASSGVVVKVGSQNATPHASAELLRVGYGLGTGSGSDGTAVFKALGGNRVIAGAAASAPTDADLMAGSVSFYLDEAGNNLKFRVKYSNGTTLKTGSIALS